jgi:hypothetical protein
MQAIEVSDDIYRRVQAFTAVYRAVMNEDADVDTCFGILFERGFQAALSDILRNQQQAVLVESLQQLAVRDPEEVCRYIADMVSLGSDIRTEHNKAPRIGFSAPSD